MTITTDRPSTGFACPHCGEVIRVDAWWRERKVRRLAALEERVEQAVRAQPGILQQRLIEQTRAPNIAELRTVVGSLVTAGRIRVERRGVPDPALPSATFR
jgi:hypothetical protein